MDPNKRLPPPRHSQECPPESNPRKKTKLESEVQMALPERATKRQLKVYFPMLQKMSKKWSPNMKQLDLSNSNLKQVYFLQFLDNCHLTILNLNQNNLVTLQGLERCNFLSLEILYIRYNLLKENEPFHLYQMPKIIQIYLNANRITYIRTPKLTLCSPKLSTIQINSNPFIRIKWKKQEKIKV